MQAHFGASYLRGQLVLDTFVPRLEALYYYFLFGCPSSHSCPYPSSILKMRQSKLSDAVDHLCQVGPIVAQSL